MTTSGATTTIALSSGPTFSFFNPAVSINAAGRVAFLSSLDAGGDGIFSGAGGATTTIALTSSPDFSSFPSGPSINASGTVAFVGRTEGSGRGVLGVFTGTGGPTLRIVPSTEPFQAIAPRASINAAGTVAWDAVLDPGEYGTYVGNAATGQRVLHTGDPLFGSTFIFGAIGSSSLNDVGQFAFRFSLADGRTGVAVATPVPEPSTALLLAAAGGTLLLRRLR